MIAIDQDARGIAAFKMVLPDSVELWVKPLKNNELALCFFNRTGSTRNISLNWKDLIITDKFSGTDIHFGKEIFSMRDMWARKAAGDTKSKMEKQLASHDVLVLRLKPAVATN